MSGSQIFGSVSGTSNTGIILSLNGSGSQTATIVNNKIFGQGTGINDSGVGGTISGNSIHDNSSNGIYAYVYTNPPVPTLTISANNVFNNGGGIYAYGANISVTGNAIYNQAATGASGLGLLYGAVASGNVIYGNYYGVYLNDTTSLLIGNRIFENSMAGVEVGGGGAVIENNRIYSNGTGVLSSQATGNLINIQNNLIYQNVNGAINLNGSGSTTGFEIIGNTLWQSVGTVVNLAGSSTNTTLADNIIWGDEGTLVALSSGSTSGFQALYNLYYRGQSGAAKIASIAGTTIYTALVDWKAEQASLNAGSLEGNPDFIAIAGADGVLGGLDTALGGGADDNFTPGPGSPAIDASDAYLQMATDMLGDPRHDDPATQNSGTGQPVYIASSAAAASLPAGTAISGGQNYAGSVVSYTLPFTFTFYGVAYNTVYIDVAGAIFFSQADAQGTVASGAPSVAALQSKAMIAPFWSASDTRYSNGDGVFQSTSSANGVNYITFRFAATPTSGGSYSAPTANFAVTLGSDGSIAFSYGSIPSGLTGVIGLSAGTNGLYTLASVSGQSNLSNSSTIVFTPNSLQGLRYYDIGALEFQGSSSNTTPPTIVGTVNLPANGVTTDAVFTSITLNFSEALDPISATSLANYQLIAGPKGNFGTVDDISYALTPVYSATSQSVTLVLTNGALPNGYYELVVSPKGGLLDASGNALVGNGGAGTAYVAQFVIDRSIDKPPVVASETLTVAGNQTLAVTLSATDPKNLALTYAITTAPQHGQIENFDATAGTFTYVPDTGYVGADTIAFSATDTKLATASGSVTINVTKVYQPPIAAPQSDTVVAGRATVITLSGSDLQTPLGDLILQLVAQPAHGVATITGQNQITYTANAGYSGADSFTFAWEDAGNPPDRSAAPSPARPPRFRSA